LSVQIPHFLDDVLIAFGKNKGSIFYRHSS